MNTKLKTSSAYHHGNLRQALLDAARDELEDSGLDKFSLRKMAKRAGVSHAAPAHHFSDLSGLLTALAADGFRRFLQAMLAREEQADQTPRAQLIAAGLGYIDFAVRERALFRLIHGSDIPQEMDADLQKASNASFEHLVSLVTAFTDQSVEHPDTMPHVAAHWAMAHGLADLLSNGRLRPINALPQDQKDEALRCLLMRAIEPDSTK